MSTYRTLAQANAKCSSLLDVLPILGAPSYAAVLAGAAAGTTTGAANPAITKVNRAVDVPAQDAAAKAAVIQAHAGHAAKVGLANGDAPSGDGFAPKAWAPLRLSKKATAKGPQPKETKDKDNKLAKSSVRIGDDKGVRERELTRRNALRTSRRAPAEPATPPRQSRVRSPSPSPSPERFTAVATPTTMLFGGRAQRVVTSPAAAHVLERATAQATPTGFFGARQARVATPPARVPLGYGATAKSTPSGLNGLLFAPRQVPRYPSSFGLGTPTKAPARMAQPTRAATETSVGLSCASVVTCDVFGPIETVAPTPKRAREDVPGAPCRCPICLRAAAAEPNAAANRAAEAEEVAYLADIEAARLLSLATAAKEAEAREAARRAILKAYERSLGKGKARAGSGVPTRVAPTASSSSSVPVPAPVPTLALSSGLRSFALRPGRVVSGSAEEAAAALKRASLLSPVVKVADAAEIARLAERRRAHEAAFAALHRPPSYYGSFRDSQLGEYKEFEDGFLAARDAYEEARLAKIEDGQEEYAAAMAQAVAAEARAACSEQVEAEDELEEEPEVDEEFLAELIDDVASDETVCGGGDEDDQDDLELLDAITAVDEENVEEGGDEHLECELESEIDLDTSSIAWSPADAAPFATAAPHYGGIGAGAPPPRAPRVLRARRGFALLRREAQRQAEAPAATTAAAATFPAAAAAPSPSHPTTGAIRQRGRPPISSTVQAFARTVSSASSASASSLRSAASKIGGLFGRKKRL